MNTLDNRLYKLTNSSTPCHYTHVPSLPKQQDHVVIFIMRQCYWEWLSYTEKQGKSGEENFFLDWEHLI